MDSVKTKLPFHILAKPIGPICNLDCRYCFYLRKESMFPDHHAASDFRMNDETLEAFVKQNIQSNPRSQIDFAWQGGEPTLMGLDFFRRAVELQKRYCPEGKTITNAIQTNGTLLNDEWGEFLAKNGFLVGISIDGPRELHDRYRVDRGGRPTFDRVMQGLAVLKKHGAEFNTLTVVHRELAHHPLEVYDFLLEIGSRYLQFIPLVERLDQAQSPTAIPILGQNAGVAPWSVEPLAFGIFLSDIFDRWVARDVGRVFVQTFDVQVGIWAGYPSMLCLFGETCGRALAIEHTGDLYSCDHFVSPPHRLGNILNEPMHQMVDGPQQQKFGNDKRDTLPQYCRTCEVRFACNGECPKNRFISTPDGEPGLNYLCAGYKHFLNQIRPEMEIMAALIKNGRSAAEVMQIRQAGKTVAPRDITPARNRPCRCGSGKKFKHCCGRGVVSEN